MSTHMSMRRLSLSSAAVIALLAATPAFAQSDAADQRETLVPFDIAAGDLSQALNVFAHQSGQSILYAPHLVEGRTAPAISGEMAPGEALERLLASADMQTERTPGGAILIRAAGAGEPARQGADAAANGEPAAGNGAAPVRMAQAETQASPTEPAPATDDLRERRMTLEQVTVTAQRREEALQDVPIAVSAFSGDTLDGLKIEGGPELVRAVPNVAFTKTNFSMYNFSIRGVGTSAISAASDPGVAISFNNTPLIRNRLFEQEYLDVERVEVLRGPQGTLYGRNATAGVVNLIPQLPELGDFNGNIAAEVGNYDTRRLRGLVNVPVTDTFAIRLAGASTERSGFDFNTFTDEHVNDRDLWSTRLSALWEPNDRFRANLIWEHFEEDDQRSRTGKQLCTRDPGPTEIGGVAVPDGTIRDQLSQGCLPRTLFSDEAFGVPNAGSFPAYRSVGSISFSTDPETGIGIGIVPLGGDPYEGLTQSRDLREIATSYDPQFRTENDVVQFNLEFDLSDTLTVFSQTAYAKDDFFSTQDYARYVSNDIFADSSLAVRVDPFTQEIVPAPSPIAPGGIYTDPQLGPSTRMESADLSQSDNEQWYQELRLQSSFDGRFNFLLGANYLEFSSQDDYYVFNNLFTLLAEYLFNQDLLAGLPIQSAVCDENYNSFFVDLGPAFDATTECVYVDPSPIGNLAGDGHNYFRSKNVVNTTSWAIFGEAYWDIRPDLSLTAGLRYTDDEKVSTPFPTQLLLGATFLGNPGSLSGGTLRRGFIADPDVVQQWEAVTGRLVLDWTPDLTFTDDTLIYGSYARGYKGGGTNPPRAAIDTTVVQYLPLEGTFEPEYVNAFELGAKNTLMRGNMLLNLTGFYYDYSDYQVSQITDRTSFNENFDAEVWGLEFETDWQVNDNFRLNANVGYLNTRIADGEGSIDVMNRTAGDPDWTLIRPWVQVPSNCIAPTEFVETILDGYDPTIENPSLALGNELTTSQALAALCAGSARFGAFNDNFVEDFPFVRRWDQVYGFTYDPFTDAPNGGRGIETDLSGNELPNAPNLTASVGAQYSFFLDDWELTPRADYYWQGESYFRVYNTEYDRLDAWENLNLSVTLARPRDALVFQLYVKNVFDDTPITGAFTNSDDTQLTTNVFTIEPRIWGLRVSKGF